MFTIPIGFLNKNMRSHVDVVHGSQTPYITVTDSLSVSGYSSNNIDKISISILATFDVITNGIYNNGILFEAGGSGFGLIIYLFDGKLYAQAGKGNGTDYHYELEYTLTESTYTNKHFDFSFEKSKYIVLFIDHIIKKVTSYSTNVNFFGSNYLGIKRSHSTVAQNRGNWVGDNKGVFSQSITYAKIYNELSFSDFVITMLLSSTSATYDGTVKSVTITPQINGSTLSSLNYTINGETEVTGVQTYQVGTNSDVYNLTLVSTDTSYLIINTNETFTIT